MSRRLAAAVALWLALFAAAPVSASGGSVDGPGGRVVHYGTMNTAGLTGEVAQRLQVKPDPARALIVLSPRDAQSHSLPAQASGHVRRLTGQRQTLQFREVGRATQRDLVAEFEILNGERLVFEVDVRLEGIASPLQIRFNQPFYRGP